MVHFVSSDPLTQAEPALLKQIYAVAVYVVVGVAGAISNKK
jgi:hypothetical protein